MKDDYNQRLAAHKTQLEAFMKTKKGQQLLEERKEQRLEKAVKKKKNLLKALEASTNKPKKPLSSFFVFVAEKVTGQKNGKEKVLEAASVWNKMSDTEKAPYVAKSKALGVAYEKDMAAWEKKMASSEEGKTLQKIQEGIKVAKSNAKK